MKKVKGIPYPEVKAKALQTPDVMAAYLAERRDTYRREAATALEEYRQTGVHLTMEEADYWLSRLEAGNNDVC